MIIVLCYSTAFGVAGAITAYGNGTNALVYSWTDRTPYEDDNDYRVNVIDKDGAKKYSSVVKVTSGGKAASVTVLPNPATNNTLHLQMTSMPAGRYNLVLFNNAGQKIFTQTLHTSVGSTGYTVPLPARLPRGLYCTACIY